MRWAAFMIIAVTVAGGANGGGVAGALLCGGLMLAAVALIARLGR